MYKTNFKIDGCDLAPQHCQIKYYKDMMYYVIKDLSDSYEVIDLVESEILS